MAEDTAAGRGGNPDRNVSRPLLGRTVTRPPDRVPGGVAQPTFIS